MRSRVPASFHIDLLDVAIAAEVWASRRWDRGFATHFARTETEEPQVMCGGRDASDTLGAFVYDRPLIDLLRSTEMLADIGPAFWQSIENATFSGEFTCLEDGTQLQPSQTFAVLRGRLGDVLLFRGIVGAITDMQISIATSARSAIDAAPSKARFVDDGSRRTFGHGWSLWTAGALETAGFQTLRLRLGYVTELLGAELEVPFPSRS
jgi:nicotinic acid phosphoribosyltransferase